MAPGAGSWTERLLPADTEVNLAARLEEVTAALEAAFVAGQRHGLVIVGEGAGSLAQDLAVRQGADAPAGEERVREQRRPTAPPGVRFVPEFVPDAQLAAFFERADVVVLPYADTARFDQSGVLATALAFGRPVVLSDIGGFSELAATGAVTGSISAPPRSPQLSRCSITTRCRRAPIRS